MSMADKVTELRPSQASKPTANALRQRRYRARKNASKQTGGVTPPVSVTPPALSQRNAGDVAAYMAAIGLASVAALFSIRGMVTLFPGAPVLIIAMACTMEASKLIAAGWLARRWRVTAWTWRLVLVALIGGLA